MKRWILLLASAAAVAVAAVVLMQMDDARDQRRRAVSARLWHRGGGPVSTAARLVADRVRDSATQACGQERFLPWPEWPSESQALLRRSGIEFTRTVEENGLAIAEFEASYAPDARWFYVVPRHEDMAAPWFLVVAMDPESILFGDSPSDSRITFEPRSQPLGDHLVQVRRICRERDGSTRR